MGRLILIISALIGMAFIFSCETAPAIPQEKAFSFSTNGFLDDNHYQVTASSKPDQGVKGLVAQRESALIRARNELQKKTIESLVSYRFNRYLADKNFINESVCPDTDEVKEIIREKLLPYIRYGKIAEEYYEKDNAADVVFRIEQTGLRKSIDSLEIKLKPKDKKEESK
ncbi:MAG TPA: hypothetical protein VF857_03495 [Spirochaetota bacterium]